MSVTEHQLLETFLIDNQDLEQLEVILSEFNLFEAVGAVQQELRHSDFLAFLLNPRESHGLGGLLVQRFLLKAVQMSEQDTNVTPLDFALWSGDDLEVRREWQNIDILLLDASKKWAIIIENKVGSGEHSSQLKRYHQIVQQHFSGWRILPLFLSPDRAEPSDDRYIPIDYTLIHDLLKTLTDSRQSTLGPDIQVALRHYTQLLRRHIMPDSDIAELCQKIYRQHPRALDLIFEHRPDKQSDLFNYLVKMVEETPGLVREHSTKTRVRFVPRTWESPVLLRGEEPSTSNKILYAEFGNFADRLSLKIIIAPGPSETRKGLFDLAHQYKSLFNKTPRSLSNKYTTIYSRDFLRVKDYEEDSFDVLTSRVQMQWRQFVENTLLKVTAVLKDADWLWEEVN